VEIPHHDNHPLTPTETKLVEDARQQLIERIQYELLVRNPDPLSKEAECLYMIYAIACADRRLPITKITALWIALGKIVLEMDQQFCANFTEAYREMIFSHEGPNTGPFVSQIRSWHRVVAHARVFTREELLEYLKLAVQRATVESGKRPILSAMLMLAEKYATCNHTVAIWRENLRKVVTTPDFSFERFCAEMIPPEEIREKEEWRTAANSYFAKSFSETENSASA